MQIVMDWRNKEAAARMQQPRLDHNAGRDGDNPPYKATPFEGLQPSHLLLLDQPGSIALGCKCMALAAQRRELATEEAMVQISSRPSKPTTVPIQQLCPTHIRAAASPAAPALPHTAPCPTLYQSTTTKATSPSGQPATAARSACYPPLCCPHPGWQCTLSNSAPFLSPLTPPASKATTQAKPSIQDTCPRATHLAVHPLLLLP
jgi:hypothetical protein